MSHVAGAGGMQGKRTGKTEQGDALVGLSTVLFAALTVVLVLIPLLGPIMLPTWAAIVAALGAGILLGAIGLRAN
jgi:hypothetical protein